MSSSSPGDSTLVDEYLNYLAVERGVSLNTLEAYSRDIGQFLDFAASAGVSSPVAVRPEDVTAFLGGLREQGLSSTSMNR
ncbi:MAG: site-specific integrase, partial [Syntrophaceae bacterium]